MARACSLAFRAGDDTSNDGTEADIVHMSRAPVVSGSTKLVPAVSYTTARATHDDTVGDDTVYIFYCIIISETHAELDCK